MDSIGLLRVLLKIFLTSMAKYKYDPIRISTNLHKAAKNTIKEVKRKDTSRRAINKAKKEILAQMEDRYLSEFSGVGSRRGINIIAAMRSASWILLRKDSFSIKIADPSRMDQSTELPPTKSEGKIYNLWSLLREGWGQAGGKRPDRYVLYVRTPGGIAPPKPSLLSKIYSGTEISTDLYKVPFEEGGSYGTLYYLVRHPGYEGYDWILHLDNQPYKEDIAIFNRAMKQVAKILGNKFNKSGAKLEIMS